MNGLTTLASIALPEGAYLPLLVFAGILIITGLKRLAFSLMAFVFLSILLPPLITPLLAQLPDWLVWLLLAFLALSLVRFILGPGVWANMVGTLLANLLTALVVGLLRLPVRLVRMIFGQP